MKLNINNLYYAKCRHYIMDIVNVTDIEGNIISPHPDYIDYYDVLVLNNGEFLNVFDTKVKYILNRNLENCYFVDTILEISKLTDYIREEKQRLSKKECASIDCSIKKTKSLKLEYGYKK